MDELNISKDEPIELIDVLNPFLFGPKLIDLDVLIVLHVLNLTWDELCDSGQSFWWSQNIEKILNETSDKDENAFKNSFEENKLNSMNFAIDCTPKEIANMILTKHSN